MIDHVARITDVVKSELNKQTLAKETVGYAVGLAFGTVPIETSGQIYVGPLWMVAITMRSPLLKHEDIQRALPVFGIEPDDSLFRQVVGRLLAECRKEYDESLKPAAK